MTPRKTWTFGGLLPKELNFIEFYMWNSIKVVQRTTNIIIFSGLMSSLKLTDTFKMQTQLSLTCTVSSSPCQHSSVFLTLRGLKVLLISGLLTQSGFRLGCLPFCDGISSKIAVSVSVPLSLKAPEDYDSFIEQ